MSPAQGAGAGQAIEVSNLAPYEHCILYDRFLFIGCLYSWELDCSIRRPT